MQPALKIRLGQNRFGGEWWRRVRRWEKYSAHRRQYCSSGRRKISGRGAHN